MTRCEQSNKGPVGVGPFPSRVGYSFIIVALIKLWLVRGQTLYAIGLAGHDDRLYLNLANALLEHGWLGRYSNLTLAKGPFYPFWIAIMFVLGVPLLLSHHLLYIAACLIFVIAVRPILSRPTVLLLVWAVLLFHPITYASETTRVIREGIYPALTVLVASCSIGILLRHDLPLKSVRIWSIGLGFALSAFWLTREEGVWMMPSILMLIGLVAIRIVQARPVDWRRLFLLSALPFGIWIIALGTVAGINKAHYGTFSTVEFKSPDFLAAYGALTRVKHAEWQRFVLVPKETRERIYEISPAFAELKPYLEGDVSKGWTSATSCSGASICNDIGSGWFMWALRDAAAAAAHHASGSSAAKYYRRLATEINTACADRKIACKKERATMMPPWRDEYVRPLLTTMARAVFHLARFESFAGYSVSRSSEGSEDSLLLFRDLTHDRLSPTAGTKGQLPRQSRMDNLSITILTRIGRVYQIVMPVLVVVALIAYMISTLYIIRKRTITRMWMINAALLVAIVIRLFILSMIEVTSFHGIDPLYLAPTYPLLIMFIVLTLVDLGIQVFIPLVRGRGTGRDYLLQRLEK